MFDIVLFGGTTEGREIAEFLSENSISSLVCVATEYGGTLLDCSPPVQVQCKRMDKTEMIALFSTKRPRIVIDATHPYATQVSENIHLACQEENVRYVRVLRERLESDGCMSFASIDSLIAWLNQTEGIIFAATGAKEAGALTHVKNFVDRVFLRLIPSSEGVNTCMELGYPMKHLICMQGPFSKAMNIAMFREVNAKILVTKESGKNGGFAEKLSAAIACNMTTAILSRPTEQSGLSLNEAKALLLEVCR